MLSDAPLAAVNAVNLCNRSSNFITEKLCLKPGDSSDENLLVARE